MKQIIFLSSLIALILFSLHCDSLNAAMKKPENTIIAKKCPRPAFLAIQETQPKKKQKLTIKSFQCTSCPKSFPSEWKITAHERTHTGEKPFSCTKCYASFTQKGSLTRHMKGTHAEKKSYACYLCKNSYAYENSLKLHQRKHDGERLHPCTICPKKFFTSGERILHEKIHSASYTDEKPYACSLCSAQFHTKDGHLKHMAAHAGDKVQCPLCDIVLNRKYYLIQHLRALHPDYLATHHENITSP